MIVDIFVPCFIDQIYPDVAKNMVKLLENIGCTVNYNKNQTCCGQPAFNAGFWGESRKVAEKFMKDFDSEPYIVVPSASCVGFVQNQYAKLFEGDRFKTEIIKDLQNRIIEISEFLVYVLKIENFNATFNANATYHDSCAALRECNIKEGPRKLLQNVKGLNLLEMNDVETCCGFGGTFSVKFNEISNAMLEQKAEAIINSGADYVISTDSSCLMHIDGFFKHKKIDIKMLHLVDVLAKF